MSQVQPFDAANKSTPMRTSISIAICQLRPSFLQSVLSCSWIVVVCTVRYDKQQNRNDISVVDLLPKHGVEEGRDASSAHLSRIFYSKDCWETENQKFL